MIGQEYIAKVYLIDLMKSDYDRHGFSPHCLEITIMDAQGNEVDNNIIETDYDNGPDLEDSSLNFLLS